MKNISNIFFFLFFVTIASNAQSCYESSLKDLKKDMAENDFSTAINRINSIKTYCKDIPVKNELDSIQHFAEMEQDKLSTAEKNKKDSSLKVSEIFDNFVKDNNKVVTSLRKKIATEKNLNPAVDSLLTKAFEYDFNKDGLLDVGVVYYYKKSGQKYMSMAVYIQTNNKEYSWNSKTRIDVLKQGCKFKEGIFSFKGLENGVFVFADSTDTCKALYEYDNKLNTIKLK
jgi:hypothetical protein